MTREEKIQAFAMRLDGYTLKEIGDTYGLTRERIRQMFAAVTTESGISRKNYIFPNISDWMAKNKVTQQMLAKEIGVCQKTVSQCLTGRNNPSYDLIRLIIDKTGMPFEVAFSNERITQEAKNEI